MAKLDWTKAAPKRPTEQFSAKEFKAPLLPQLATPSNPYEFAVTGRETEVMHPRPRSLRRRPSKEQLRAAADRAVADFQRRKGAKR